jgi:tetratricopeptide (TPR) repeat protein
MSLLIKALDKAQEAKAQENKTQAAKLKQTEQQGNLDNNLASKSIGNQAETANRRKPQVIENVVAAPQPNAASAKLAAANALEMELSPISNKDINNPDIFSITSTFNLQESASTNHSSTSAASSSKTSANNAANVFAAKRIESNNRNTILALIAGVAICILLAMAAYYYLFINRTPDIAPPNIGAMPANNPFTAPPVVASSETLGQNPMSAPMANIEPAPAMIEESSAIIQSQKPVKKSTKSNLQNNESLAENEVLLDEQMIQKIVTDESNQFKQTKPIALATEEIASKSASIQISRNQAKIGVNPVLMDAYNAYNAGNDTVAGKLYRQVLQQDVRNVDALLGLGAIAQRQGRNADANGWYGKVLEVEPRNVLATTAILQIQPQNDLTSKESRIKNMLAKQPEDANLHVALGNFYADLNQWPAAQQAYFEAYRLNASAENAFNLAVSLDQLNKPKLALPYYQQALQRMLNGSNIDKNALQARIDAIQ